MRGIIKLPSIIRIQVAATLLFIGKTCYLIGVINGIAAIIIVGVLTAISSAMVVDVNECEKEKRIRMYNDLIKSTKLSHKDINKSSKGGTRENKGGRAASKVKSIKLNKINVNEEKGTTINRKNDLLVDSALKNKMSNVHDENANDVVPNDENVDSRLNGGVGGNKPKRSSVKSGYDKLGVNAHEKSGFVKTQKKTHTILLDQTSKQSYVGQTEKQSLDSTVKQTQSSNITKNIHRHINISMIKESISYHLLIKRIFGTVCMNVFLTSDFILNIIALVINLKVSYCFLEEIVMFDSKIIVGIIFFSIFLIFDKKYSIVDVVELAMIWVFFVLSLVELAYLHRPFTKTYINSYVLPSFTTASDNTAFLVWSFYTQPMVMKCKKIQIVSYNAVSGILVTILGITRYLVFLKTDSHFFTVPYLSNVVRVLVIIYQLLLFTRLINRIAKRTILRVSIFVLVFYISLIISDYFYIKQIFLVFGCICMFILPSLMHIKCFGVGINIFVYIIGMFGALSGVFMLIFSILGERGL